MATHRAIHIFFFSYGLPTILFHFLSKGGSFSALYCLMGEQNKTCVKLERVQ